MKHYCTPHITSYTDAELNEFAEAALRTCSGGFAICESNHMICTIHTGECMPAQYCSKSYLIHCGRYKP